MRKPVAVLLASTTALVAAFGLIACGGGSDSGSDSTSAATTTEQSGGGGAVANEGQTVFVQNCGTCHTLSAAGTDGNIGPNLDSANVDYEEVKTQVINGGGGMPAWKGVLSDAQIDAVSAYVSENAGK
jgi:cytochrome c551